MSSFWQYVRQGRSLPRKIREDFRAVSVLVIHQGCGQLLPGVEDARLHSAHWDLHFLGNLVIMVTVQKHGERLPEIWLQIMNRPEDVRLVDFRRDSVDGVVLTCVDEVLVLGAVQHRVLELLTLVIVDEDVPHDGVKPSFHVGPFLEVVLVPQRFDHGVLDQIVRVRSVPRKTEGKTAEEIRLTYEEVVEFESAHDSFCLTM